MLIRYYHVAAGFPTKLTWLKAIEDGHFTSWVGLSAAAVRRHFPKAVETWKSHGRKIKMNLRSTKKLIKEEVKETNKLVGQVSTLRDCHHVVYNLQEVMDRHMYTDQTGRFPTISYRVMQYVMVLYEPIKSNQILVEPMRNRTSGEMLAAYQTLVNELKKARIKPKSHILDNECSSKVKEDIKKNVGKIQLVPPNDDRQNVAEKNNPGIKNHFISVLCGCKLGLQVPQFSRMCFRSVPE